MWEHTWPTQISEGELELVLEKNKDFLNKKDFRLSCAACGILVFQFSSAQLLSRDWLFATPWIAARQASLSITNSWSSLKLMSIESVMPSSHLILCRPLLLLPLILPSIRVFSNESALRMRWPKYWSFSFSIIPSKEHPGLISFRMNWLDLLAVQGTLKSLLQHHSSKASILLHSAFRWLGHYIYWYDLVHLAIWFLFCPICSLLSLFSYSTLFKIIWVFVYNICV